MVSGPETIPRREINTTLHMSLHDQAGAKGSFVAMDAMWKMANFLSVIGGEIWERLKSEDPASLIELEVAPKLW